MKGNLYGSNVPFMIDSGTFGRCRHGHTHFIPCWRCGIWHPVELLKHLIAKARS